MLSGLSDGSVSTPESSCLPASDSGSCWSTIRSSTSRRWSRSWAAATFWPLNLFLGFLWTRLRTSHRSWRTRCAWLFSWLDFKFRSSTFYNQDKKKMAKQKVSTTSQPNEPKVSSYFRSARASCRCASESCLSSGTCRQIPTGPTFSTTRRPTGWVLPQLQQWAVSSCWSTCEMIVLWLCRWRCWTLELPEDSIRVSQTST